MDEKQKLGRYLCYLLRHKPESAGLMLNRYGYADAAELIEAVNRNPKYHLDWELLREIAATDGKRRYQWNEAGDKIRACQGHSFAVDLELKPLVPPDVLYHGTPVKSVESILQTGIRKCSRQYVHLSPDYETAVKVGERRGRAAILLVDSGRMHRDGFVFYRAGNGVWLTDFVPCEYINLI